MGCLKLKTDFFYGLEVIHSRKRGTHEKKRIDYYPFGLKHKNYNNNVTSSNPALDFKYNGVEQEKALGVNFYEMDLRQYDPAIARWTGIDPVTHHSYSTYSAFDNNPVYYADPSGADAVDGAAIGGNGGVSHSSVQGMLAADGPIDRGLSGSISTFGVNQLDVAVQGTWTHIGDGQYKNNTTGETTDDWQKAAGETVGIQGNDSDPETDKKIVGQVNNFGDHVTLTYELVSDEENIHKITLKGFTNTEPGGDRVYEGRFQTLEIIIDANEGDPKIISSILSGGIYNKEASNDGDGPLVWVLTKKHNMVENYQSELTKFITSPILKILNLNPNYNPWNGRVKAGDVVAGIGVASGITSSLTGGSVNPITNVLGARGSRWFFGAAGGIFLGNIFREKADHSGRTIEYNLRTGRRY